MWLSYNDTYEVSDEGEVRNKKTGRIKQPSLNNDGYLIIHMKCLKTCRTIHRLVAERFLPAPTAEDMEVDHIDQDRLNNNASNLRWLTHSDNMQNKGCYKSNTSGHKYIIIRPNNTYRVQIKRDKTLLYNKTFKTLNEALEAKNEFISS